MGKEKSEITFGVLNIFSGIGGGAKGMQESMQEYKGLKGNFKILAGIDSDPEACEDFKNITDGAPVYQIDLFDRQSYIDFHGVEPPSGWREAVPQDIRDATGGVTPDIVVTSPPCKGFSGLLPKKSAESKKYKALNELSLRSIYLALLAYEDDLPGIFLFENVPRITTRGQELLLQIKQLLSQFGYVMDENYHDCGEIGALGQHRRRYLLIARNPNKISTFVYKPQKYRVRSIGEILENVPLPDDPSGGPMHKLPRLEFKTWVRLALIPPGGDWRDLEKIAPDQYKLEYVPRGGGPFGVQQWDNPGCTVIGNSSVKGSNAACVADPRTGFKESTHHTIYKIRDWNAPAGTVTSAMRPNNGAIAVADPRLEHSPRDGAYKAQNWEKPSSTVTGHASTGRSNGATFVCDPRLNPREGRHPCVYQVVPWNNPSPTVTGTRFGSGSPAIADPRIGKGFCNKRKVLDWNLPSTTITGTSDIQAGAQSVGDPRLGCKARNGLFGVMDWEKPGYTVTGAKNAYSGTASVADPRIPGEKERLDPPPLIISPYGYWHRPLTTLELAVLQGFPLTFSDGSPLKLAGNSDARHRERIGNAIPVNAAKAIGDTLLMALLPNYFGDWVLGPTDIWVVPKDESTEEAELSLLH